MSNRQLKQIADQRKQTIKWLMPDVCQILPMEGTGMSMSAGGILTQTPPEFRKWRNKTDIPCRADLSRAFRPDKLKTQATVVDEYNLELPHDTIVKADDKVFIRGRQFVIRKIKDVSNWDVTIECIIEELSTQIDDN